MSNRPTELNHLAYNACAKLANFSIFCLLSRNWEFQLRAKCASNWICVSSSRNTFHRWKTFEVSSFPSFGLKRYAINGSPSNACIALFHRNHFLHSQGVAELTPSIRRWIYLATVFGPASMPIMSYSMILAGSFMLMYIFVRAYKNFVFNTDPTIEILEMGRRSIRRGSSFLIQHQHRIMMHHHQRDSYTLLKTHNNNNDNDILS